MMKSAKLVLFLLSCLVIALLFTLPVQQVLPLVKLPTSVHVHGIDGTIFKGTAREVVIDGFPLSSLNYRYLPSCIPSLKVCYQISYERGTARLAYDVLNGNTEISQTRVEYPIAELVKYMPNVPVNPLGRVELAIENLTMLEGKPVSVAGKLIGRAIGFENYGGNISLGDYQIDLNGDQQKYDFKLSDLDANLGVAGKGEIKADGQYSVDLKIASEDSIDPNVKNILDFVAKKTGYNQYRVQQKGRLPPNLTRRLFN